MKKEGKSDKNQSFNEYPKVTTWDVFREYWKLAKTHPYLGITSIVAVSTSTLVGPIIIPLYYKDFFDLLSMANPGAIEDISKLSWLVFLILLLNLITWVLYRTFWFSLQSFEAKIMAYCKQNAFDYLLGHSHNFFLNNFAGSVVQKINRFARSFERVFDRMAMDIFPLVLKIVGISVVLYLLEPKIFYIILIWIILFLSFSFATTKVKLKYDVIASELDSKVSAALSDSISNHNSTELFSGNIYEGKKFERINMKHMKATLFRWHFGSVIDAVQSLLTIGVEFALFYYAIRYWQLGILTVGTFVLIQAYILNMNNSLWNFGKIVRDIFEGVADAKEMVEILHLPHEIQDLPNANVLKVENGTIDFKNVSFSFGKDSEKNKKVFDGLTLNIKAGEKIALIGSSGAGKSTLVKLLLRLHDIKQGEILIDNQNIKEVTQESLRNNISLVPQDPALFHRTLMENIRYGKRDATDEEVIQAAKLAHCDIFINDFPHGYDTYVGERGVKLSGGERQRVAIARAILKNAPILVLDEATSSLDSHSESLIQDALHTLMEGKTTLVIAHRLSTIRKMDRIIVLGKEGVVEEGSHDKLVGANGVYAKLWKLQAGGFTNKSIEELLEV